MSTTGGIPEETRIRFTRQLRHLRESDETEIAFPPTLSNVERMFLHNLAKELGLVSKSQGKGEQRFITVSKRQEVTAESAERKKKVSIAVEPAVRYALQQHFAAFPEAPSVQLQPCLPVARHRAKPVDVERIKILHARAQESRRQHADYARLQANRKKLPAHNYEDEVCQLIENNQIILISGETGCGKTTQVPQFILDHPVMGPTARILVTQPRRISAIAVAERIAEERSEGIGGTIGYNIRLDRVESDSTQVLFVTPGILLRKLESDPLLDAHTHIIIDEAHERDRFTEFIMIVMKDILPQRPDLKLILMSATLQTNKLADYFGGCPQLQIGSSMFPVQEYFLEDVLRLTDYVEDMEGVEFQIQSPTYTCALCGKGGFKLPTELGAHAALCFGEPKSPPPQIAAPKLTTNVLERLQQAAKLADASSPSVSSPSRADEPMEDNMSETSSVVSIEAEVGVVLAEEPAKAAAPEEQEADRILDLYTKQVQDESVDLELIEALLEYIFSKDFDMKGSVLVFLPGWDDISRLGKQLRFSAIFSNPDKFRILPLHSGIPKSRQKEVFQPVPDGCYKIVLSTNIAETSITIDDIVVVIDSGRVKEQNYDPHTKLALLQPQWISQSSARQRKGRAGRTRAGVCFHLFSRRRHAALPVQQDSELLRMPLEEVCLQAKALGVAGRSPNTDQTGELLRFLSNAMDAPHPLAISNAVDALKHIGCLTELEQLTPVGVTLSKFTMHPRLGWMVLLGVLCGCPTAAVTAACAVAGRDPFVVPMDPVQKRQAMAAKVALSRGYRSDQFALVTALSAFNMYRQRVSFYELVRFCDEQFLSMSSLTMYADTVQQTVREVKDLRMHAAQQTKNENDHSLLVALIGVGLYPNHAVRSRNQTHWFTPTEQRARIHMGSVNNIAAAKFRAKCQEAIQILAFQNLVENKTGMRFAAANLMMMNTTPLHVLLLLLIADEIHEATALEQGEEGKEEEAEAEEGAGEEEAGAEEDVWEQALESASSTAENPEQTPAVEWVQLRIDGWLMISCPRGDWTMLAELRSRIKSALAHICTFPTQPLPDPLQHAVDTLVQLIRETQPAPLNVSNPTLDLSGDDVPPYPARRGRGGYSRGGRSGGPSSGGAGGRGGGPYRGGSGGHGASDRGRGRGGDYNAYGGRGGGRNSAPERGREGGRRGGRGGGRGGGQYRGSGRGGRS